LTEKEGDIPEGGTITLAFVGRDKWKYTPGGRLLYSYRLDQHDWTPFLDANSVSFTDLPAGKHYFQVRALDRNGNLAPAPATLEFAVALLWYHETRLLVIALAGLAVALFFASLSYNRHRKLVQSYAEVERKVADRTRELELANRELLHSQKMNALGTLAAGIAHDFNNILSIIKGSAQIIEDNADNPQKIRTRVDRIKTVVEQGSGVVNAMLGFSRESDGPPTLCDLNEVVADTLKLLGDRFHRDVEVDFQPAGNLPSVRASKDFAQQILLNFIFNAAESMTAPKRIVITARRANELPAGVVLPPAQAGGCVLVAVRDSGSGIAPEIMPRIFEPFFTTKAMSERRGTGLGLSMVYELAKKLGAGLAVESVVAQGSTFTLILTGESKLETTKAK
jgi:signal transduction histidine kinase